MENKTATNESLPVSKYCWETQNTAEDSKKQVLEQITQCGRFTIEANESTC